MRWQPVFKTAYRCRGRALKPKVDIEVAYQRWMFSLLGKRRAFALHEQLRNERRVMGFSDTDIPVSETDYPVLTVAEVAAVEEASYGYSQAETAEHLHKSEETVRRQIRTATNRMGARSLTHLIALAIRSGQVLSQQRPKGYRARQRLLAAMSEAELFSEQRERRVREAE